MNDIVHDALCRADDQLVAPKGLPVRTAVELRSVRPERDAERGKDVSQLLEVQPDVHGGLDRTVFVAAYKDSGNLPLGQPGSVEMERFSMHVVRSRKTVSRADMPFQLIGDTTMTAVDAASIAWNAGISSFLFRYG